MKPQTEAGRELLDRLIKDRVHFNDPDLGRIILAIEAEARAAEREWIESALSDIWPANDNPTAVGITWERLCAILAEEPGE